VVMLRRRQSKLRRKNVVRVVLRLGQLVRAKLANPKVLAEPLVVQTKRKVLLALPQNSNLGSA
jgi:arsenate reductase-like glutaredoxin family protein